MDLPRLDSTLPGLGFRHGGCGMGEDSGDFHIDVRDIDALGKLVAADVELDPDIEVGAIQRHFDGKPALLFNKLKGYSERVDLLHLQH
jgi:hypothetical protein